MNNEKLEEYEFVEEKKAPIYIGFTPRLVISIILLPLLSVLAVFLMYKAFVVNDIVNIRYEEISNPAFKVYNQDSLLVTEEPIEINMNSIDNIHLDLDYELKTNKKSSINFTYQVLGDLYIVDQDNPEKIYYQETFSLTDIREELMDNTLDFSTIESIQIEYNDYNDIVKKYKESYDVKSTSYIDVYLDVKYKNSKNNAYLIEGESKPGIHIPLQEETIKIQKYSLEEEKRIDQKPTVQLQSPGLFGLGILSGLGAAVSLSQILLLIFSTMDQTSIYDRTVNTFLKKHNKKIEEIKKAPIKRRKNSIKLSTFKDLLKVQKQTNKKILYHIVNEHTKCEFFIVDDNDLYVLTIKEVDLKPQKKD